MLLPKNNEIKVAKDQRLHNLVDSTDFVSVLPNAC
jgi:hypothetical protein